MEQFRKSNTIDDLIDHMADVMIDPNCICSICKETTYETIKGICCDNCHYVCHDNCLKGWIQYKFKNNESVYCPRCIKNYSDNVVRYYVSF